MRSKFIKVLSHAGFALALVGGSASAAESASWNVGSPAFCAQPRDRRSGREGRHVDERGCIA